MQSARVSAGYFGYVWLCYAGVVFIAAVQYCYCTSCYCPAYQHYRVLQIESLQADNDFAKEQLAAMKGTSFFRPPFILWFQSFMNFLVSLFFFFTNISAALFLATLIMKVLKAAHSFQKMWKSGEEKKKSRKLK